MRQIGKRGICILAIGLLLFYLFFPISFDSVISAENGIFFANNGMLLWEFLQPDVESAKISAEAEKQSFQFSKRQYQMRIPLGTQVATTTVGVRGIINLCGVIGIICQMIFLTIIVYIYRSDGKKRFVN